MHRLVFEPVTDFPADPDGTGPALLPEYPKCLGHSVFRPAEHGRKVVDTDPRCPAQAEQNLQRIRVGQQIEAQGPAGDVDIGQRRRRALKLHLVPGLVHCCNLIQEAMTATFGSLVGGAVAVLLLVAKCDEPWQGLEVSISAGLLLWK